MNTLELDRLLQEEDERGWRHMEEERMRKMREDASVSWAVKRIAWVQAEEFKEAHEWLAELGEAKANEFHRVRKRKQEDPEAWRLAKEECERRRRIEDVVERRMRMRVERMAVEAADGATDPDEEPAAVAPPIDVEARMIQPQRREVTESDAVSDAPATEVDAQATDVDEDEEDDEETLRMQPLPLRRG